MISCHPTNEYFAKLEGLKINVASESRDPADYQFLDEMQHISDENGLVSETTRVKIRMGYIRNVSSTEDFSGRQQSVSVNSDRALKYHGTHRYRQYSFLAGTIRVG